MVCSNRSPAWSSQEIDIFHKLALKNVHQERHYQSMYSDMIIKQTDADISTALKNKGIKTFYVPPRPHTLCRMYDIDVSYSEAVSVHAGCPSQKIPTSATLHRERSKLQHWNILGVRYNATMSEITDAYWAKSLKYSPVCHLLHALRHTFFDY